MTKNRVMELLKSREKNYIKTTEDAMRLFIMELKEALEEEFYGGKTVELFLTDLNIIPQNFRFVKIEGKLNTLSIGDKIDTGDGEIELTLENFWDFSKNFSLIIPISLLDEAEVEPIQEYLREVKNNADKIPQQILDNNKVTSDNAIKEFKKVEKELDEVQLMALKLFKSASVH